MLKFVIKRILSCIPVLFVVITLIFFMIRIIPGDPALNILGEDADPADVEALRERLGLNDPILVQYVKYLKGIIQGDWVLPCITTFLFLKISEAAWSLPSC